MQVSGRQDGGGRNRSANKQLMSGRHRATSFFLIDPGHDWPRFESSGSETSCNFSAISALVRAQEAKIATIRWDSGLMRQRGKL
jgi:hypothetical protein